MSSKKYTFFKKEKDEEEIDLGGLVLHVFSRWRSIVALGLIGCIVGLPIGYWQASKDLLDVDDLSPSIVGQLDNYANQKALNEKLNEDDSQLYIMSLDPDETYYQATLEYTVRTDTREDVQLAAKYLDVTDTTEYLYQLATITGYDGYINNLNGLVTYESEISEATESGGVNYIGQGTSSGSSSSASTSTASVSSQTETTDSDDETADGADDVSAVVTEAILEEVLEDVKAGNTDSVSDLISQLSENGQAYASITYTVRYLTLDQIDQFTAWLNTKVIQMGQDYCSLYSGFKIKQIKSSQLPLRPTAVQTAQQEINSQIAERATETDIAVETLLAKYSTTIAATATSDGSSAIIDSEEKEMYQEYWESLTDDEYDNSISKKKIVLWAVIVGVVFGILVACGHVVVYIARPASVDEEMLRDTYNLNILGYVEDGRKKLKGLDRIFSRKNNAVLPCTWQYMAQAVAGSASGTVVIAKTESERDITALVEALKSATDKEIVTGDITTDAAVLAKVQQAGEVFLTVELGKTKAETMEAALHLIEMQNLDLGGVIMV